MPDVNAFICKTHIQLMKCETVHHAASPVTIMWINFFQNEEDVSRESSPCKSPDTGIKAQGTGLYPNEKATELVSKCCEETGMNSQKFICWGGAHNSIKVK
jgi:hypothetical protein